MTAMQPVISPHHLHESSGNDPNDCPWLERRSIMDYTSRPPGAASYSYSVQTLAATD